MKDSPKVLLVSLGTSPAIVPEAFLLPGVSFQEVHVLTTEKPDVQLVHDFFERHAPRVKLTISRVADFYDFKSEDDHFLFEDVLHRWILEAAPDPQSRYFCLSGGFKTMSAAVQKAAAFLGAAEAFHVLADLCCTDANGKAQPPTEIEEILEARNKNKLHWIRLGRESGWPQLRTASAQDYPLSVVSEAAGVRRLGPGDQSFRNHLRRVLERSHHIADSWDRLPDLPFAELAAWAEPDLTWLKSPLDPASSMNQGWVKRLPKIELHCHLGGFATNGQLLEDVRGAADKPRGLPPIQSISSPSRWPLPSGLIKLEDYRHLGDNNGSALLRDPGCLRRQCELLYAHLLDQNILYAEIRCSPANYACERRNRSPWDVLVDIRSTFQNCLETARNTQGAERSHRTCHINLILIGTRQSQGDYRAGISRHLALAITAAEHWRGPDSCRVVGVDLAGFEDVTTRAHYFREEFAGVHRCGLALTVHAGENDDTEGVWSAVFDLNARRLGHALTLAKSPELLRSVAARGIGIEMCPYANLQIRGFPLDAAVHTTPSSYPPYPLLKYLEEGARVTVNTDNIGISAASLTDNLLLAARLCPGLSRLDLLRLQRNALDTAFIPPSQRSELVRQFSARIPLP